MTPGQYTGPISQVDNRTEICVECGIEETSVSLFPLETWPIIQYDLPTTQFAVQRWKERASLHMEAIFLEEDIMDIEEETLEQFISNLEDFAKVNDNKLCMKAANKLRASFGVNKTLMKANIRKREALRQEEELSDCLAQVLIAQMQNEPNSLALSLEAIKKYNAIRDKEYYEDEEE